MAVAMVAWAVVMVPALCQCHIFLHLQEGPCSPRRATPQ